MLSDANKDDDDDMDTSWLGAAYCDYVGLIRECRRRLGSSGYDVFVS